MVNDYTKSINFNICYGCMKPLERGKSICLFCGYNCSQRQNPKDALPEGTVLHGKYLVGKLIGKNGESFSYLGYNLVSGAEVRIKELFFEKRTTRILPSYDVRWSGQGKDLTEKTQTFLHREKQTVESLSKEESPAYDTFYEHNTVYVVVETVQKLEPKKKMPVSEKRINGSAEDGNGEAGNITPLKNGKDAPAKQKKRAKPFVIVFSLFFVAVVSFVMGRDLLTLIRADQALKAGRYEDAAGLYTQVANPGIWGKKVQRGYQNSMLQVAEEALRNNNFQQAMKIYEELNLQEKADQAGKTGAEEAMSQGNYLTAADLFEYIGDETGAKSAWDSYGSEQLTAGCFEDAVAAFQKSGNKDNEREAYSAWGDDLFQKSDYDGAIEQYKRSGESEKAKTAALAKAESMISTGQYLEAAALLGDYSGQDIAQTVFAVFKTSTVGMNKDDTVKQASEFGEKLRALNTQIEYCRLLKNDGYELNSVYPDGVEVDADLSKYQLFEITDGLSANDPDCSHVLVFSREEEKPGLESKTALFEEELDQAIEKANKSRLDTDYGYRVRFLPGMMDFLPEQVRAGSEEECTSVILFEKGYIPDGNLTIRTSKTSPGKSLENNIFNTNYQVYLCYEAYEGIAVYEKENPMMGRAYDGYVNHSPASKSVVGNDYSDAGIDLSSVEIEEIQKALENEGSEESRSILSQYDEKIINFVKKTGWGDYILFPDTDSSGKTKNFKGTALNVQEWNTEKYMLGRFEENWLKKQLEEKAMEDLARYVLLNYKK